MMDAKKRYTDDGRITAQAEYGSLIPLCCADHKGKRWYTKNIAPIGCRTIFYNLMNDAPDRGPECDCSWTKLEVV